MFIEFEGIENVRDLGGLLRADGAKTKKGLLFRTGRLKDATEADLRKLSEIGISAVIDFRDDAEVRKHPDGIIPGAKYYSIPALPSLRKIFGPPRMDTHTAKTLHDEFHRLYLIMAQSVESDEAYAQFFRILLESEGKPVLWHCTQGKDRTGIAALLLLTALGLDEETILRDYLLTNDFMQKKLAEIAAMENPPMSTDMARELFLVYEDNLRSYRRCIEIEYGSVENYLELVLAVGPDEIETLEKYYMEFPE